MKTIGMKDRNFFIIVRGLLLMLLLMGLSGCKPEQKDGKEESITSGEENRHPNYTVEFSAVPIKQNTALEYAVSCIYGNDLYYVGTKNQKSVIYQHNLTSGKESVYLALNQKLTIKGICFSKDGNLDLVHVLRSDISTQCVMEEFSAERRILQHNIYTTQFLTAYIANGLARTNKGKYCIQVAMGAGKHGVAKLIDADHTVVKVYNRTCLPEDIIGIGYAINDEGVLLYDETGLYIYDGADNCEMLFRWSEVAILGENVRAVTQTEDEILALITDVSGKNAELARIRKWGEEREEKVLTLATVYASDTMKSLVSEYNSHKQGCQIKLIGSFSNFG